MRIYIESFVEGRRVEEGYSHRVTEEAASVGLRILSCSSFSSSFFSFVFLVDVKQNL